MSDAPRVVNYGGGPILITRTRPDELSLSHNDKRCGSLLNMGGDRWRLLLGEPVGAAGFTAQTMRWFNGDEDTALAGAAPWVVLASRGAL